MVLVNTSPFGTFHLSPRDRYRLDLDYGVIVRFFSAYVVPRNAHLTHLHKTLL